MNNSLEALLVDTAEMIRPAERLNVWQAAEKYIWISNPGSYVGPWKSEKTPYMREPLETLTSDEYTEMIFVGSAQMGKTDMFADWMTHTAKCDPADMILYHTSQQSARYYSGDTMEKLFRHSKDIRSALAPGAKAHTTTTTRFRSGMKVRYSWPSITEMSSKTVPKVFLTDYDRMPEDVDGEGAPHALGVARTTVFGSRAMCVSESTPGRDVLDPNYVPKTKHEAPHVGGILSLYNKGDRRRFYWQCFGCREWFEPDRSLLRWDEDQGMGKALDSVHMECPHCGQKIYHDGNPDKNIPGKAQMNLNGRWVKDGQWLDREGKLHGEPVKSTVASFWLKGVAAGMSNWRGLLEDLLNAEDEFERTGKQENLKVCINTKFGEPYVPRGLGTERLPELLKARAREYGHKVVPKGVRFLIANIDVQKNMFKVQVHGFGVGGDIWVVDRFDVKKSERKDTEGDVLWVKPGSYVEDWKLLISQVMERAYPLHGEDDMYMQIKMISCDSAGEEGVTAKAYEFYKYLKYDHEENPGLYRRFILTKGSTSKVAPRQKIVYPESTRKGSKANANGEVPVMMLNTHELKCQLNSMLDRTDPFGGRINFPKWLPDWFYEELCAERLTPKGWKKIGKNRNEAWDLLVYAIAVAINKSFVGIEDIDWDDPPGWAEIWEENDLVFSGGNKRFDNPVKTSYNLGDLAKVLT
jgi:phage terminase large subunit GpA-like protein